jgi:hypothetical protein
LSIDSFSEYEIGDEIECYKVTWVTQANAIREGTSGTIADTEVAASDEISSILSKGVEISTVLDASPVPKKKGFFPKKVQTKSASRNWAPQ